LRILKYQERDRAGILKYIYIHTHTHTHIYIYNIIYIYIYIYIEYSNTRNVIGLGCMSSKRPATSASALSDFACMLLVVAR